MTLFLISISILSLVAGALYVIQFLTRLSKDQEKLKYAEKSLENIEKANQAISRARSDNDISSKLRDRYKIK